MYIITDHKAQFLDFLSRSALSPSTIRDIKNDINYLFKWFEATKYDLPINTLIMKFEDHLIISKQNSNTVSRRVSSANKFVNWLAAQYDQNLSNRPVQTKSQPQTLTQPIISKDKSQRSKVTNNPLLIAFIGPLLFVAIIFLILFMIKDSPDKLNMVKPVTPLEYSLKIELTFPINSNIDSILNKELTFKFYNSQIGSTTIGTTSCLTDKEMIDNQLSLLTVHLGKDCGMIPSEVVATIGQSQNIFVDVYIYDNKITSSAIEFDSSKLLLTDSGYQNSAIGSNNEVSIGNDNLLLTPTVTANLTNDSSSFASSIDKSLPIELFVNDSDLNDGDIVAIFNNQLTRALLSTKVLGIKSSNLIVTEGITMVNISQSEPPITTGSYISTSSEPGIAKKAVNSLDNIIGVALENSASGSSKLKVLMRPI